MVAWFAKSREAIWMRENHGMHICSQRAFMWASTDLFPGLRVKENSPHTTYSHRPTDLLNAKYILNNHFFVSRFEIKNTSNAFKVLCGKS